MIPLLGPLRTKPERLAMARQLAVAIAWFFLVPRGGTLLPPERIGPFPNAAECEAVRAGAQIDRTTVGLCDSDGPAWRPVPDGQPGGTAPRRRQPRVK